MQFFNVRQSTFLRQMAEGKRIWTPYASKNVYIFWLVTKRCFPIISKYIQENSRRSILINVEHQKACINQVSRRFRFFSLLFSEIRDFLGNRSFKVFQYAIILTLKFRNPILLMSFYVVLFQESFYTCECILKNRHNFQICHSQLENYWILTGISPFT